MNESSLGFISGSGATRGGAGRFLTGVLVLVAGTLGMFALAGSSKAAPVDHNLAVNHGKLTLGAVFPDNTIIPAPVMGNRCPAMVLVNPDAFVPPGDAADCGPSDISLLAPNYPDGNAHIKISVDGTTATVAAADFRAPMVYVPNPIDPGIMAPIRVSAPSGLTGTWDDDGRVSLTGDLRIAIATGATGQSSADISWCQIDAPNVTWSTGLNPVTPGIPFSSTQGLDGNGAISASWSDLPDGTEINGGDCSTVNAVIHDTGALWFGVNEATPPPAPICEPPLEGLWPDCVPGPPVFHDLSVVRTGAGVGLVESSPGSGSFEPGTEVTLTAYPDVSSVFWGWSGCDSVPAPDICVVTMSGDRMVTARFDRAPAPEEAPEIIRSPKASTTSTDAIFEFIPGSGESSPVTGFECRLAPAVFEGCAGPKAFTGLAPGRHTFEVRAVNASGPGPVAAFSWTVTGRQPGVAPARVGKITAARKGKLKRGKTATIKVKVTNIGGKTLRGKLKIKSSNRQVKAPKSARLNVRPGKTQTIKVKVKASKKARGKAKITFSAGGRKAVTKLTVKK